MKKVGTIVVVQAPEDNYALSVRLLTTVPSDEILRKLMLLSGQGAVLVGQLCTEFADRIDLVCAGSIEDMSYIRDTVDAVVVVGNDNSLTLFDKTDPKGCVMDYTLGEWVDEDDDSDYEGDSDVEGCKRCGSVHTCFC